MMTVDTIKMLGTAASAISFVANIVADWADKRKLDSKIEEMVAKAVAEQLKKN